ncbi:PHP domain-containing protein [Danxiaibacter flavus]|uniref:PHP domain-containing protein n=1 Tax=Danxiaibacter flavus TaxID=3049108 RepID=A0ABV3ZIZ3_9BACT|nr:PHP domain-containing protein [Chitinophagaceae bacterium DXS]
MASNREIIRQLSLFAELLVLHEKDKRLAGILSAAAYRLRNVSEELVLLDKRALAQIVRIEVVKLIDELRKTGTIAALDELIQLTPAGLFDMMRIRGLGGKKLHDLWHKAKIDNVQDLLKICKARKLNVPGFGIKTQQNIVAAIEALNENRSHFHYASVADAADSLVWALRSHFKTELISLCGDIRRQATTVECIEIVAAVPPAKFTAAALKRLLLIGKKDRYVTHAHTLDEVPVLIYHTTDKEYTYELFTKTGCQAHVEKILSRVVRPSKFTSEQAIYNTAGMHFIVPEMRENLAEWKFKGIAKDLLTVNDITGVVHNHTDWSDGVDSLQSFVMACMKKGYSYCIISDHSKNAFYAGGLKEDKVLQQLAAIDALNKKMAPFRIFKSIECDILVSGELDYNAALLSKFDLVIASVHQQLKMDEEKATRRLIKAIENPFTTILGHMTGRQLLIRPGYSLDFKKVIDACAANHVVIEVNANPYRLDMDWSHIPYALEKGVMISINPDAHSIAEIDNIKWGVAAARKGGLTKAMTWNAMQLKDIERWLRKSKRKQLVEV